MDSYTELWENITSFLRSSVSEVAYNVWLAPLQFVSFENDTLTLRTSSFKKNIIVTKFDGIIKEACEKTLGFPVEVVYLTDNNQPAEGEKKTAAAASADKTDYTFDNFVIGPSNSFAHAAALNVANNPGVIYNPLFIYGHSGLGKTHLLMAIMKEIKTTNPDFNIIYTSGEQFTNELILCLKNKTNHAFHEKYRNCDVLLVDDIQFISNKESTQEEFFYTFNALTGANKQIVLTSDRPPKEILSLQERLQTRFESGLMADITPPSFETRMAIVNRKAEDLHIELSEEVVTYIAEKVKKNIRQLEGVVKKIKAFEDVEGVKPNIATAKKAINGVANDSKPVSQVIETIIEEVARNFDVSVSDIRSDKRVAKVSQARQVAIYVISQLTDLSLKDIGKEFGNKHYTTVIYSLNEMRSKLSSNVSLKATVDDIIKNVEDLTY